MPDGLERPPGGARPLPPDRGDARRAVDGRDRRKGRDRGECHAPGDGGTSVKSLFRVREVSTLLILLVEIAFFGWYLWPESGRTHPFLNQANALLILKYSSIYGIAAIGAAMVIISGGVDLAPGAAVALSGFSLAPLSVLDGWPLLPSVVAGLLVGLAAGLLSSALVVLVRLPPFIATLGVMGITRGLAFIITEGPYLSATTRLPGGWRPFGIPKDWLAPIVMIVLAVLFQFF